MSGLMVGNMILLFGVVGVVAMYLGGKMLNKGVIYSNVVYTIGALVIAILLYFSNNNYYITSAIVILWSLIYTPVYLNVTAFYTEDNNYFF